MQLLILVMVSARIESCPPPRRGATPVRDLMTSLTPDQMATPDESLRSAVGKPWRSACV
ncbi:MAG: hypothetical protein ACREAA_11070 [Candidatus Polarisedimenticolia bacterium]